MTPHDASTHPPVHDGFAPDSQLPAWKRVEPALLGVACEEELCWRLAHASAVRTSDPVLAALSHLAAAGETAADDLLVAGFSGQTRRMCEGATLWRRPDGDFETVAEMSILRVAEESLLAGEHISGRTLVSRAWARSFRSLQLQCDSALLAESEALAARAVLCLRDWWSGLRGRSLLDRLLARLHPLSESLRADEDASRSGASFERLCRERAIPLAVARRQLREGRRTARASRLALGRLALACEGARAALLVEAARCQEQSGDRAVFAVELDDDSPEGAGE